jgi:predicted O-linked N-acetylglucosamine transferase (SPINDLY family)
MTSFKALFDQAEDAKRAGQHDRALGIYTYIQSISGRSDANVHAAIQLGSLWKDLGCMDTAFKVTYEAAQSLDALGKYSASGGIYTSLACAVLYAPGVTLESYSKLVRRVTMSLDMSMPKVSHLNHDMTTQRRLRVGILSPDICLHSLAYLVAQPLMRFTRVTPHELYLYHLRPSIDSVTKQVGQAATKLVHVHGMTDDAIVDAITADHIDVLIDLSGYTAESRLSVFCRRPAPVQMGWISGMMTPTGLPSLPYFMTDSYMLPPQLPTGLCIPITAKTALTYHTLRSQELDIGQLPRDKTGVINFASFNNPCKINNDVLQAWARIMHGVPGSRLHLKTYSPMDSARIAEFMANAKVDPGRLVLMPQLPSSTDVQKYYSERVDIFLDAWPCSGCLTTAEALWMGVPVVSYYTDVFCSRQSHSILNTIGVTDLSHPTVDGYVQAAVNLARDVGRLRELRSTLRSRMSQSPLCDYDSMAREIGNAVVTAWQHAAAARKDSLDALRKAA